MALIIGGLFSSISLFGMYYNFSNNYEDINSNIEYEIITDEDLEKICSICKKMKSKNNFSNRQYKRKNNAKCLTCLSHK